MNRNMESVEPRNRSEVSYKNSVKNNKNAAKPKKMHWFVHIILVLLVSASREGAPTASGGNHEFWKLKENAKQT